MAYLPSPENITYVNFSETGQLAGKDVTKASGWPREHVSGTPSLDTGVARPRFGVIAA
jgi:hypothetical protein